MLLAAVLSCAAKPLESTTWLACLTATLERCDGDLAKVHRLGREEFFAAARGQLSRFGAQRFWGKIAGRFFDALTDRAGVVSQRRGALERTRLLMIDRCSALTRLSDVEQSMVGMLDAMGLTELVTSIPGMSAVGAAVILAETGDLSRFASSRSVVKHAVACHEEGTTLSPVLP